MNRIFGMQRIIQFQSTFPRGERQCFLKGNELRYDGFNPRSREGNDAGDSEHERNAGVSIHVPARGTTDTPCFSFLIQPVSIHVPARGTTICRMSLRMVR